MTCYISKGGSYSPINTKEYADKAAAVEAFCTPAYAGAKPNEITWTGDMTFRSAGDAYEIVIGNNLKAAKVAVTAAREPSFLAPTEAQRKLIAKLRSQGIGGGSIAVRLGRLNQGLLSRTEASRLIDDMVTEARS